MPKALCPLPYCWQASPEEEAGEAAMGSGWLIQICCFHTVLGQVQVGTVR